MQSCLQCSPAQPSLISLLARTPIEASMCCGRQVTFLYKLTAGACPKSYGPNVARLAGLPASLLTRASALSNTLEACAADRSLSLAAALAAQQGTRTAAAQGGLDHAESADVKGLCHALMGHGAGQGDGQSRLQELKAMQAGLVCAE